MTRKIALRNLPTERQADAQHAALLHRSAKKISKDARDTFRAFAATEDVRIDRLTSAIVEGMHADVTRSGTSSTRRTQADPLLRLWHDVVNLTTADAFAQEQADAELAERRAVCAQALREIDNGSLGPVAKRTESITDRVATAERHFAMGMLTPEQRSRLNTYSRGYRDALGSV
jgi:hypothetical protein